MPGFKPTVLTIPRRIMSVVSVRKWTEDDAGERTEVRIGWIARCYECHKVNTLMAHQHAKAVEWTRLHICYGKDRN